MFTRQNKSVTLVELIVAILLLGMVVLTGTTIELALRRMQTKPNVQVKLLEELVPAVDMIRKDFEKQIGSMNNASIFILGSSTQVRIRVDDDNTGTISGGDKWHSYSWGGSPVAPLYLSHDNFTTHNETIAQGITYFNVVASNNNTTLTVKIRTRKDPAATENALTNPGVNLTTTIFSRLTSGH